MKKIILSILVIFFTVLLSAQEIEIRKVLVSSTLTSSTNLYQGNHLVDGTEKSWVEGNPDSGIGTTITIDFKNFVTLKSFYIKNGYGDYKYYHDNNRVKQLLCSLPNRGGAIIYLEDNPGYQKVEFDIPVTIDKLVLTIQDVYKGEKYDDTAISEISFGDWEKLNHQEINKSIVVTLIEDIYKSFFTEKNSTDNHYGQNLFSKICKNEIIPIENGEIYVVSSLTSDFFGQKTSSKYSEDYILFSQYKKGNLIPNQSLFPSMGTKDNIEYLTSIKKELKEEKQNFIEKYIEMYNQLEKAKIDNLPFLSTLFNIHIDDCIVTLDMKKYIEFYPYKVNQIFEKKIRYSSGTQNISEVNYP